MELKRVKKTAPPKEVDLRDVAWQKRQKWASELREHLKRLQAAGWGFDPRTRKQWHN